MVLLYSNYTIILINCKNFKKKVEYYDYEIIVYVYNLKKENTMKEKRKLQKIKCKVLEFTELDSSPTTTFFAKTNDHKRYEINATDLQLKMKKVEVGDIIELTGYNNHSSIRDVDFFFTIEILENFGKKIIVTKPETKSETTETTKIRGMRSL